ncbi:hypothetical protein ACFQZ0_04290 [Streptomyces erythrogriseus]
MARAPSPSQAAMPRNASGALPVVTASVNTVQVSSRNGTVHRKNARQSASAART